jgi:hypothetical protein
MQQHSASGHIAVGAFGDGGRLAQVLDSAYLRPSPTEDLLCDQQEH